jgi:hypothetical protein
MSITYVYVAELAVIYGICISVLVINIIKARKEKNTMLEAGRN